MSSSSSLSSKAATATAGSPAKSSSTKNPKTPKATKKSAVSSATTTTTHVAAEADGEGTGKGMPVGLRSVRGDDVFALPRALILAVMNGDTAAAVGTFLLLLTREGPQTTLCLHAWKAVVGLLPWLGPEAAKQLIPLIESARSEVPQDRVKYFVGMQEHAVVLGEGPVAARSEIDEEEVAANGEQDGAVSAARKKRKRSDDDDDEDADATKPKRVKSTDAILAAHLRFFRLLAEVVIKACKLTHRDPSAVLYADLAFDVLHPGVLGGLFPDDWQHYVDEAEEALDGGRPASSSSSSSSRNEPAVIAARKKLRSLHPELDAAEVIAAMTHDAFVDPDPGEILDYFHTAGIAKPTEGAAQFTRKVEAACDMFLRILRKPQGVHCTLTAAMRRLATVLLFAGTRTYQEARAADPALQQALEFAAMKYSAELMIEHAMHTMRTWEAQRAAGKREKNGGALSRLAQFFKPKDEQHLSEIEVLPPFEERDSELETVDEWLVRRGEPLEVGTAPAPNPPYFLLPYFYAHLPLSKATETRLYELQNIWHRKYAFQLNLASDEDFCPGELKETSPDKTEAVTASEPATETTSFEARWPSARAAVPAMVACVHSVLCAGLEEELKALETAAEADQLPVMDAAGSLAGGQARNGALWLLTAVVGQREPDGKNKTPGFVELGPPTGYLPQGVAPAMASVLSYLKEASNALLLRSDPDGNIVLPEEEEEEELVPIHEPDEQETVARALLARWLDPDEVHSCILLANPDDTNAQLAPLTNGLPSYSNAQRWAGSFDPFSTRFGKAFRSAYVARYGTKNPQLLGADVRGAAKVVLPIPKEVRRFRDRLQLAPDDPQVLERAKLLALFMPQIDDDNNVCHLYWWPQAFAAVHQQCLKANGVAWTPVSTLTMLRAWAHVQDGRPKVKNPMDNPSRNAFLEALGKRVQQGSEGNEQLQLLSKTILDRAAKDVRELKRANRKKPAGKKAGGSRTAGAPAMTEEAIEAMVRAREQEEEEQEEAEKQQGEEEEPLPAAEPVARSRGKTAPAKNGHNDGDDAISDDDAMDDEPQVPALAPVSFPVQASVASGRQKPVQDEEEEDDDGDQDAPVAADKIVVSRRDMLGMMNIMRALAKNRQLQQRR